MNINEWISEYHGLELTPIANNNKRFNENGILFLVEYYILKYIKGTLSDIDIAKFQIIVENITSFSKEGNKIKGLYDRGAGESLSLNKESIRKISHDNITAISAFSRLLEDKGLNYHKDIASHGVKNLMRYDNAFPESPRWRYKKDNGGYGTSFAWHPRDWFFWLTNGGCKFAWIFFPIFFLANLITCSGNETSGKLLMFVRLESGSKWSKLMKFNKFICYYILKKKYGKYFIDEISKEYYHQSSENPIRVESKNLEL